MKPAELPPPGPGHWRSIPEELAQHRLYERNRFVQHLKDAFPNNHRMWHVDRYFPYSNPRLYVDEPMMAPDIEESKLKQKAMASAGLRMLVLLPKMTLAEAREQLVEVESWLPGQHS